MLQDTKEEASMVSNVLPSRASVHDEFRAWTKKRIERWFKETYGRYLCIDVDKPSNEVLIVDFKIRSTVAMTTMINREVSSFMGTGFVHTSAECIEKLGVRVVKIVPVPVSIKHIDTWHIEYTIQ